MRFRSVPKSVTLSDLEPPNGHHFALFRTIRQLQKQTASNSLKLDSCVSDKNVDQDSRKSSFWQYMVYGGRDDAHYLCSASLFGRVVRNSSLEKPAVTGKIDEKRARGNKKEIFIQSE